MKTWMNSRKMLLMLALVAAALAHSLSMYGQTKGEMSLGVTGGYATYHQGGMANIYFHYSPLEHLRIAPEIGYMFSNNGLSGFEMGCDLQFPFRIVQGLYVYPLAGLTLNRWTQDGGGSWTRVGGNFGGGLELYFTSNFKINLQGKFSWMSVTSGGFFNLGCAYVF